MQPMPPANPNDLITLLPGPGRKRLPRLYRYRLVYRDPAPAAQGCVLIWEVSGGATPYQLVLERSGDGSLRLHCSCADSAYRGEAVQGHTCKHVRGLLDLGRAIDPPTGTWAASA